MSRLINNLLRSLIHNFLRICKSLIQKSVNLYESPTSKIAQYWDRNEFTRRAIVVPNLLTIFWIFLLLWGEIWIFHSKVKLCRWEKWEKWPKGASPHHLIFLADPQLIDPHSYPNRIWPLDQLTMIHTDKYLKRSYKSLQEILHPDTIIFLGDLFDGGREWKADRINEKDISWSNNLRPPNERVHAKLWAQKYGEDFWIREYKRFGKIFFKTNNLGKSEPGPGQRGRKILCSLPGNHDLGFGDKIKLSIRNRFQVYFGDGNRIDIIGNHTFVSVDSVSLSASGSNHNVVEITKPVEDFLVSVQASKRKAIARELGYMTGKESLIQHAHKVEDLATANFTSSAPDSDPNLTEFPTILLTHVPLYRKPGTPCGPQREHWPPASSPKGHHDPVHLDERNAISISKGYQYQNVLSQSDSIRLMASIGNVTSVFSGDDHDYCEIVHPADMNYAREITVKSVSWAMGVRRPGFLLLSMWNPVDLSGGNLHDSRTESHGSTSKIPLTLQSHLCLLPDQIGILICYIFCAVITIVILICRATTIPSTKPGRFATNSRTCDLPISQRSSSSGEYCISEVSSSYSSRGALSLAPRNTRNGSSSSGYKYMNLDHKFHDASLPITKITGSHHNKITHATETNKLKECDHGNEKMGSFNEVARVTEKKSIKNIVLREAWTSIWHMACIVLVLYFFIFLFY